MATFQFYQWTGTTSSSVSTGQGTGDAQNDWDFKDNAVAGTATTADAITAGSRSVTVWVRGKFTGTFSAITGIQYWVSARHLGGYGTGAEIEGSQTSVFATPTSADYGAASLGTTTGDGLDLDTAGLGGGGTGFSKFAILQLLTAADATPGTGSSSTFTMQYNET